MKNLSAKQITLNYLESIKRDIGHAIDESINSQETYFARRAFYANLAGVERAIHIVRESEGDEEE